MIDAPELTTTIRRRTVRPLVAAWAFVVVALVSLFIWLSVSPDLPPDKTSSGAGIVANAVPAAEGVAKKEKTPPSEPGGDISAPISAITSGQVPDQRQSLITAPIDGLTIIGPNGPLPVLGPDSRVAWKAYARPVNISDGKPQIAIIITGIGLNSTTTDIAIKKLRGQIDLAFSPYGRKLQYWMDKSRQYGHEGFLMIPTEPVKYPENDPGPHTLLAGAPLRDNLKKLNWLLSQLTGYVGVINEMGSKFTTSEKDVLPILKSLKGRGLMFVDARASRFSIAAKIARRISMPRAINNLYLDNVMSPAAIRNNLARLENTAHTYGTAIGEARALPMTINEIEKWSRQLEARGFHLVPVTAIANRQPIR